MRRSIAIFVLYLKIFSPRFFERTCDPQRSHFSGGAGISHDDVACHERSLSPLVKTRAFEMTRCGIYNFEHTALLSRRTAGATPSTRVFYAVTMARQRRRQQRKSREGGSNS